MRIAVVANTTWYLYNSRRSLMRSLADAGHQVIAVGQTDDYVEKLTSLGIRHRGIPMLGASVNPFVELKTVRALQRIFREENVELVLSYTPKGNIYSALASKAQVALIPNVSGLGRVFVRPSLLTPLVKFLYRLAFGRARRVLFENSEDLELFAASNLVDRSKAERIAGSGIDLSRFSPCERNHQHDPFVFLLVARMLWDKGVGEYIQAARKLRATHPHVEFRLLGFLEVQNPSAIEREQMRAWEAEGVVRYLGATDDVVPQLCEADCVVLPSYREGLPRSLLEASAMAKPLITTDTAGCRDTVDDGVTGFLCRVQDAEDLAAKMLHVVEMDAEALARLGQRGREKIAREFDEKIVVRRYLELIEELVADSQSR